jgi:hypothetical protein
MPNADLRLAISTAAFVNTDGTARVELSLTGQLPDPVPGRARDDIGLAVHAFTPDGRSVAAADQRLTVTLTPPVETAAPPAAPRGPLFELSSEISLKPGRYSLRVGVHSAATDKTGSVYTEVTIPDFAKEPLTLSGALLTSSSGTSLRGDALAVIEPTTRRTLSSDDRIQAFLRVYQGGTAAPASVSMKIRIVDEHNTAVVDRAESLPATAFSRDRQADYSVRLPLASLKPGEYWLSIEAAIGKRTVRRDVRFGVR